MVRDTIKDNEDYPEDYHEIMNSLIPRVHFICELKTYEWLLQGRTDEADSFVTGRDCKKWIFDKLKNENQADLEFEINEHYMSTFFNEPAKKMKLYKLSGEEILDDAHINVAEGSDTYIQVKIEEHAQKRRKM